MADLPPWLNKELIDLIKLKRSLYGPGSGTLAKASLPSAHAASRGHLAGHYATSRPQISVLLPPLSPTGRVGSLPLPHSPCLIAAPVAGGLDLIS